MTLPLLAVGAVGVIGVATHWCAAEMGEMIAAFAKGDVERARELNARLLPSCAYETGDADAEPRSRPRPCSSCSACRSASAGSRWARPRPASPTRPERSPRASACSSCTPPPVPTGARRAETGDGRPQARRHDPAPVTVTFLGGLGEIGRNCAAIEVEGRIMLLDCGLMFPDADMLGHRPRAARLHLAARARRPHRGVHRHPRPRGPHRRPVVPAARAVVPDLRLGAHPRPGPQPHRGGRAARPHRADRGRATTSGGGSARSTASSSRSPTRCPTGSPPRSTRRRARSSTPATSSSTSRRSTAGSPTSACMGAIAAERGHPAAAVGLDQRRPARATPAPRRRWARCSTTCSTRTRAGASSPPASPATSTASSRSPTPPSASTGWSPRSGMSMRKNVRLAREMGLLRIPDSHLRDIEDVEDLAAGQGLRDLHRLAGRAHVGAGADGGQREPLAEARRPTTR